MASGYIYVIKETLTEIAEQIAFVYIYERLDQESKEFDIQISIGKIL